MIVANDPAGGGETYGCGGRKFVKDVGMQHSGKLVGDSRVVVVKPSADSGKKKRRPLEKTLNVRVVLKKDIERGMFFRKTAGIFP